MATAEQTAAYLKTLSPSDIAKALRLAAWDFDVIAANMDAVVVREAWKQTAKKLEKAADEINALWKVEAQVMLMFVNGVELKNKSPKFNIPSIYVKNQIVEGDRVQVGFIADDAGEAGNRALFAGNGVAAERLWLRVTSITPNGKITGQLTNTPFVLKHKVGDEFIFNVDHVLDIMSDKEK